MGEHRLEVHLDGERFVAWSLPGSRLHSCRIQPHHGSVRGYDMIFNRAEGEMNNLKTSPGQYAGEDNGSSAALFSAVLLDFDKTIIKYPNIERYPGGASNDFISFLEPPNTPVSTLAHTTLSRSRRAAGWSCAS